MTDKIIRLIEKSEDSNHWSVEDALREALKDAQEKEVSLGNCDKVLILGVNTKDGKFDVSFVRAKLRSSECIAVCRVAEAIFLKEMEYL